jgi:hypothetical protein
MIFTILAAFALTGLVMVLTEAFKPPSASVAVPSTRIVLNALAPSDGKRWR